MVNTASQWLERVALWWGLWPLPIPSRSVTLPTGRDTRVLEFLAIYYSLRDRREITLEQDCGGGVGGNHCRDRLGMGETGSCMGGDGQAHRQVVPMAQAASQCPHPGGRIGAPWTGLSPAPEAV